MADLPDILVSPKELVFEGGDHSKPIARHLALTNPHNCGTHAAFATPSVITPSAPAPRQTARNPEPPSR